jgi:hypothetical protein
MTDPFSRRFDPRRNYAGVLFQTGQLLTAEDFNEQSAIAARRVRAAIVDIVGRIFVATPDAFRIASDGLGGLTIGRGRLYVDGLLAENHGAGAAAWDPVLDEERGADPIGYARQPYLDGAPALPRAGGPYLVYLDVWQREVTAVEDPSLREVALGGPDTAARLQTVWQVKWGDALPEAVGTGAAPSGVRHHYAKLALFTPPRRIRDLREGMAARKPGRKKTKVK